MIRHASGPQNTPISFSPDDAITNILDIRLAQFLACMEDPITREKIKAKLLSNREGGAKVKNILLDFKKYTEEILSQSEKKS